MQMSPKTVVLRSFLMSWWKRAASYRGSAARTCKATPKALRTPQTSSSNARRGPNSPIFPGLLNSASNYYYIDSHLPFNRVSFLNPLYVPGRRTHPGPLTPRTIANGCSVSKMTTFIPLLQPQEEVRHRSPIWPGPFNSASNYGIPRGQPPKLNEPLIKTRRKQRYNRAKFVEMGVGAEVSAWLGS